VLNGEVAEAGGVGDVVLMGDADDRVVILA
jgi:hypothetical protein